jgi:hypothetical protein
MLSREFLQQLFMEDSAHYLLYCIAFVSSPPVTMYVNLSIFKPAWTFWKDITIILEFRKYHLNSSYENNVFKLFETHRRNRLNQKILGNSLVKISSKNMDFRD